MNISKPPQSICPICVGIHEPILPEKTLIRADDIILRTDNVVALINSFFIPGSEGHVIVVPLQHFKNIYELPDEIGSEIFKQSRRVAAAMRQVYPDCEGITVQQNNERSGGQHVNHYHLHVIPRYHGDLFGTEVQTGKRVPASEPERARFGQLMRNALDQYLPEIGNM